MTLEQLAEHYGFIAVALAWALREILPWALKQIDRKQQATIKAQTDDREARQKAIDEERLADLKERDEDRKFRRQMDAERTEELKAIRLAMETMSNSMITQSAAIGSVRLAETDIVANQQVIIGKQDMHHNEMMRAVGDMREEVSRRRGVEEGKKLPKTGPMTENKGAQ